MHPHLIGGHVEGDIAGMKKIVREIFLDERSLIAATEDEIADAVEGIDLKNVTEDREASHFHHGLRAHGGFFAEACAEATGEDHGFNLYNTG